MPRKTIIIFITVFILVGALVLGYYFYVKKSTTTPTGTATDPSYQPFLGTSTTPSTSTGTSPDTTTTPDVASTPSDTPQVPTGPSKFHQISDFPVAGAVFFEDTRPLPAEEVALPGGEAPAAPGKTTTKAKVTKPATPKFEIVPSLRYVERITGHIHQMYLDTKIAGQVSNSTIPSIYEAFFDGKASSVIYRYLGDDGQTITSFLATLGAANGEFLPSDILDMSVSPDKSKFFYLTKTASGVVGTTRSFKDTKKTQVFTSSITEWLSQWVTDQKVYLTTKASSSVNGSVFSLNIANGVLTKVFGGVPGLTTLANGDGSLVLYSSSTTSGPKLHVLKVSTHTSTDIDAYSLPEKCVWADTITLYCAVPTSISGSQYPDVWYQGLVSFTDQFVKINTDTLQVNFIADSNSETPVDAVHLFLDKAGTQLFFINKKDSTLWSVDLK